MFGKRKRAEVPSNSQLEYESFDDGIASGADKREWNKPSKTFLQKLGLTTKDADDAVETNEDVDKRVEAARSQALKFTADMQSQLPAKFEPWMLIPAPCWEGERGDFLIRVLEFTPYDPWNIIFLPVDERSSLVLDIPMIHPGPNSDVQVGLANLVNQQLDEIYAESRDDYNEMHRKLQAGEISNFGEFAEAQDGMKDNIQSFSTFFGIRTVGDQSYWRSRYVFYHRSRPEGLSVPVEKPLLWRYFAEYAG